MRTKVKKQLWVIMYSTKVNDFITFNAEKLDCVMSFELSVARMLRMDIAELRHYMTTDYNAKIKNKREPKSSKFYLDPESIFEYTEIYFESKEDAEKAIDWIRAKLIMYIMEHPEYKISTY